MDHQRDNAGRILMTFYLVGAALGAIHAVAESIVAQRQPALALASAPCGLAGGGAVGGLMSVVFTEWLRHKSARHLAVTLLCSTGSTLAVAAFFSPAWHVLKLGAPLFVFVATALVARFFLPDAHPSVGHCPDCGYNLHGNLSGVCPECGRSHNEATGT